MPRTEFNGGKWTEAKFHSFVKSALRAASRKWPPKFETINDAYVGTQINASSGRLAKHFRCAACAGLFTSTNIQVDHIHAIIDPKIGFTNWDDVVSAMFCEKENLQVLCKPCHKIKTAEERKLKKESKNG
jgi:5-methylcytosine-specific restriction endonuclease McrA